MALRLTSITLTCADAPALAEFYRQLLGGDISATEPDWCQLRVGEGSERFTLNFEREAHWTPPVWPSQPGRQFASQHLDICVDDLEAAKAQALACGARMADQQFLTDCQVYFDPAGHPFCLFVNE